LSVRQLAVALASSLAFGCGLAVNGLTADDGGASPCCAEGVDAGSAGAATDGSAVAVVDSTAPGVGARADGAIDAAVDTAAPAPPDAAPPRDAAPSPVNFALDFTGSAYVDVGTLPIPPDFTLEAWIRPAEANAAEASVIAEDRDGQAAGQFRLGLVAGRPFFMMSDAAGGTQGLFAGNAYALEGPAALLAASWAHVAVTKAGGNFTLYVGGAQVASFTATGPIAHGGPAVPFRIGARVAPDGTTADDSFTGPVDEVRLWSTALAGADIVANMTRTVSPSAPGLLAYWRFDEGAGTLAGDEEGSHPGTMVGPARWVTSTAF